ncbi:unnamed protein product [Closterium sp. Naga37s-1]|nr:unnamed protein product [Closterium sp. Naga37s-1]
MGSVMLHGHEKGCKLDARAVMCVCVRVDMESNGWRMLDPSLMRIRIARDVDFLENVMWKDWDKAKGFWELLQDAAEISQLLPLPLSPPSAALDDADMPLSSPPPAPLSVSVQQQPAPLQQLSSPSVIQRKSATQASSSSFSSGQRHVTLSASAPMSTATTSPPGLQVLGIESGTGGEEVGGDAGGVKDIDQSPFARMFDLETVPDCPDSGDMNAADNSFLNLVTAAAWTTCNDYTGKPGGKSGEKSREENVGNPAARKQLLAALMQALVDSADDTATAAADDESAALAARSRKRKASEIEAAPSASAPAEGGSEAEVTRELRCAICAVILRGSEPSRPAPAGGAAGFAGAPAPSASAYHSSHHWRQDARPWPAADALSPAHRQSPTCRGGTNGAADDDDWMPRNRGRKDRQMVGERIKVLQVGIPDASAHGNTRTVGTSLA